MVWGYKWVWDYKTYFDPAITHLFVLEVDKVRAWKAVKMYKSIGFKAVGLTGRLLKCHSGFKTNIFCKRQRI